MTKVKKAKLSIRERKLIKGIASGLIPSEAARQAGYADSTINDHLKVITDKPKIKEAIADLMDRLGLNDEALMQSLKDGLSAIKPLPGAPLLPPQPENIAPKGSMAPVPMVPDHAVRHKYLETALDLKGLMPAKKIDATVTELPFEERLRRIHGAKGGSGK